jgi:hypothetical protein
LKALPAWLFAGSGAFVLFSFSSQMESEVTSLYALVLALSVLARHTGKNFYFALLWLSVGFVGTLKSPLHSCLLGVSVLIYFAATDSIFGKLFSSPARISFLFFGILLAGSGYLIPFVFDREHWLSTYIFREQIDRPRFSDSALSFLLNNFLFHIFPWTLLLIRCVVIAAQRVRAGVFKWDELTIVSFAFLLPTFTFFFGLGYLAPWYGLPMLAPLVIFIVGQLQTRPSPFKELADSMIPWSALMIGLVFLCHISFYEGTQWWTAGTSFVLSAVFLLSFLIFEAVITGRKIPQRIGVFLGAALFWTGSLGLTATLGESELTDVRNLLEKQNAPLNYENLKRENYSEWGYMAYMTGQPSYYSTSYEQMLDSGRKGHWLVFSDHSDLKGFLNWLNDHDPKSTTLLQPEVHIWRRWPRNLRQLREIWKSRESTENIWDKSARHFMLVRFGNSNSHVSSDQ